MGTKNLKDLEKKINKNNRRRSGPLIKTERGKLRTQSLIKNFASFFVT